MQNKVLRLCLFFFVVNYLVVSKFSFLLDRHILGLDLGFFFPVLNQLITWRSKESVFQDE